MQQELAEGTRVVLSNMDPKAADADTMYAAMKGLHGEVEDYAYVTDFEAYYYTVRYDNGETAISQRFELTVETEDPRPKQAAKREIRSAQDELATLKYALEDCGRHDKAAQVQVMKLDLEDIYGSL